MKRRKHIAAQEAEVFRLPQETDQRDAELVHGTNISRPLVAALESDDLQALQQATSDAEEVVNSIKK